MFMHVLWKDSVEQKITSLNNVWFFKSWILFNRMVKYWNTKIKSLTWGSLLNQWEHITRLYLIRASWEFTLFIKIEIYLSSMLCYTFSRLVVGLGGSGNIKTVGDSYQFAVDVRDFSPEDVIIMTSKNQIEVHAEKVGSLLRDFEW